MVTTNLVDGVREVPQLVKILGDALEDVDRVRNVRPYRTSHDDDEIDNAYVGLAFEDDQDRKLAIGLFFDDPTKIYMEVAKESCGVCPQAQGWGDRKSKSWWMKPMTMDALFLSAPRPQTGYVAAFIEESLGEIGA